jgi:hypothetical protein
MNHLPLSLVLADIGDIIGSLVGIVFLVIWVVGQLAGGKKQEKPPQAQRPAQPPQPQAGQPAGRPQAQPAAGGDPLRNQVEEFLRRAGQQQKPDQAQPGRDKGPQAAPGKRRRPAAKRDKIEMLVPDEPATQQRKPLSEPFRSMDKSGAAPPRVTSAAAKEREFSQRGGQQTEHESVAEHVAEHVGESARSLAEHSAQLGHSVVEADEQFDVQLNSKFDHALGSLSKRHDKRMSEQQAAADSVTKSPAQQIADMLTNPEGVRQAIILNEILGRPPDRWK